MSASVATAAAASASAPSLASAPPDRSWTVTMADGTTPASTGQLFSGQRVVPGSQVTDAYLIRHGAGVNGSLVVRARPLSEPNAFEQELSVTLSTPGGPVKTARLADLLRDEDAVEVVAAMPRGEVRLDIAVGLDATATNAMQRDAVRFVFVLTVSGTDVVIPEDPGGPGVPTSPPVGAGGSGGSGGLSSTGVEFVPVLVAGAILAGAGIAAIIGNRRVRRLEDRDRDAAPAPDLD
ncbi:hypothetical protein [Plantibacter sp. YIM 135249]|uniref:hypothetical protein n=1 Tax=Plantibacter sp. YIM 135249 TaxID=3423918 RepID=UPI003D331E95